MVTRHIPLIPAAVGQAPSISRQRFDPKIGRFGDSQGWVVDQFWPVFRDFGPYIRTGRPISGHRWIRPQRGRLLLRLREKPCEAVFREFRAKSGQNRPRRVLWCWRTVEKYVSVFEEILGTLTVTFLGIPAETSAHKAAFQGALTPDLYGVGGQFSGIRHCRSALRGLIFRD